MMMTLLRNYLGTWLVGTIQCTGWGLDPCSGTYSPICFFIKKPKTTA